MWCDSRSRLRRRSTDGVVSDGPFPQAKAEEDTPWVSVSDLMSGLMLVFLCIAVLFMREVKEDRDRYADVAEQYAKVRLDIEDELKREFPKNNAHGAQLVEGELIIRFLDDDAGYRSGKSEVPEKFKRKLGPFMTALIDILEDRRFKEHIVELRIEGHTSSDYAAPTPLERYLANMALSQQRALHVLEYVMGLARVGQKAETRTWLQSILRANGMSSSKLRYGADGLEDKKASKRVEFRIVTDADKRMEELLDLAPKL